MSDDYSEYVKNLAEHARVFAERGQQAAESLNEQFYVLSNGSPADYSQIFGPFDTDQQSNTWAKTHLKFGTWEVCLGIRQPD